MIDRIGRPWASALADSLVRDAEASSREAVLAKPCTVTELLQAVSLILFGLYDWGAGSGYAYADQGGVVQLVQHARWIPAFNIEYRVGIDGLSFPLVILSTFICVLAAMASWNIDKMSKGYWALFLFLETGILGVFLSLDFFLFYVFFEISLLPMYFLIGIWGGPRREYAAIKFFLYTLFGSVLLLVTILYLYFAADPHSFDMTQLGSMIRDRVQELRRHNEPAKPQRGRQRLAGGARVHDRFGRQSLDAADGLAVVPVLRVVIVLDDEPAPAPSPGRRRPSTPSELAVRPRSTARFSAGWPV